MKIFVAFLTSIILSLGVGAHESETDQDHLDLSLINAASYDLSKPIFNVKPTLGRGLRDQQSSSGGSACASCAH